jgi:hypothetical protein
MTQAILDYLPGYMFDGRRLVSTGAALPPTQHINEETGELTYYVRPLFEDGATVGMFVRHLGVVNSLTQTKNEEP